MYETLSLALLSNAHLTPDWMTVYVGIRGIEIGAFGDTAWLLTEEVQAFALDLLAGAVGTPDEWNVYQVADGASLPHSSDAVDALRALAGRTGISPDLARRKWRYAVVAETLPVIVALPLQAEVYSADWDEWYEKWNDLYRLYHNWSDVSPENLPPKCDASIWDNDENKWNQTLIAYNEWREREYAAIIAEKERGAIQ